jgi:hypothetical protein
MPEGNRQVCKFSCFLDIWQSLTFHDSSNIRGQFIKPIIHLRYTGIGKNFKDAARDYLYLLDHKYSQKSILKLTGDRYALNSVERSVLYRGISSTESSRRRAKKLIELTESEGSELHIDGYNVLITIGSYLNGDLVFLSTDKILRDASEIHGKAFRNELFNKAILLIFTYLQSISPGSVNFYFDKPISHSGALCERINILFQHYEMKGFASTLASPDHFLKTIDSGKTATSDSSIIDRGKVQIIDLPKAVIQFHYKKDFVDLVDFIT